MVSLAVTQRRMPSKTMSMFGRGMERKEAKRHKEGRYGGLRLVYGGKVEMRSCAGEPVRF